MNAETKHPVIAKNQMLYTFVLVRMAAVMGTESVTLLQLAVQFTVTVLLSLLSYFAVKKAPQSKALTAFCAAACLFLIALDLWRLYALLRGAVQNTLSPFIVLALLVIAAVYAAFTGLDAVARAALFFLVIVLLFLLTATVCSTKAFSAEFSFLKHTALKPQYSELDIPVLFYLLSRRSEKPSGKPLVYGISAAYLITLMVYAACIFSMGRASLYNSFPVLSLFQLEGLGSALNLDVLFSSAYLMTLFFRTAVLLGAAGEVRR